jgi:hypothetical protein
VNVTGIFVCGSFPLLLVKVLSLAASDLQPWRFGWANILLRPRFPPVRDYDTTFEVWPHRRPFTTFSRASFRTWKFCPPVVWTSRLVLSRIHFGQLQPTHLHSYGGRKLVASTCSRFELPLLLNGDTHERLLYLELPISEYAYIRSILKCVVPIVLNSCQQCASVAGILGGS